MNKIDDIMMDARVLDNSYLLLSFDVWSLILKIIVNFVVVVFDITSCLKNVISFKQKTKNKS